LFAPVRLANPLKPSQHAFAMKTNITSLAPSCLGLAGSDGTEVTGLSLHAYAQKLARIEAALARMDSGRYGFCLTCEGRIKLTRLEADPAEAHCDTCDVGEDA
jgi:hypothetical protein